MAVKQLEFESLSREGVRVLRFRNMVATDDTDPVVIGKGIKSLRVYSYGAGVYNVDVSISPVAARNRHIKEKAVTNTTPTVVVTDALAYSFMCTCTAASGPVDVFVVVQEML